MIDLLLIEVHGFTMESFLPLMIIIVPLVGSLFIGLVGLLNSWLRNALAMIISALTLYMAFELYSIVSSGYLVFLELPALAGIAISLNVDLTGSVFTLFSAAIWLLATAASGSYMHHEEGQTRYFTFLILTLGGCLGVFLSGDFLSLFLFFEMMTLAAYALVVHTQKEEAMNAGSNYLYLGIIGGLALLSGIILLYTFSGSVVIAPRMQDLLLIRETAVLIALLMIAGFGVKAGMIPLHIWLPQAHPVAPSPASALLSGIMIKTGAYGIIRVAAMLFTPRADLAGNDIWVFTAKMGHVIIWIGIMTMLLAALMALLQNNAKRLLAYSSISQMGYILMGIGAAVYLGYDGPMGFGGFSYHIINHAFFKSGLFILFGVIYARLHEIRLDQLGGLWRIFPITFIAFAVCAFGITGIPGFNGYVSKTLLHHAIVEAYEYHHLWDLWLAEKLFMLTSGLTVCYISKLFISIFLGRTPSRLDKKLSKIKIKESFLERLVALAFISAIVFLGLYPKSMIGKVIVPMADSFTYSDYYLAYLSKTNVWDIHDLFGIAIALALGIGFYILFKRKDLFSYTPPQYFSVEYSIYRPAMVFFNRWFTRFGRIVDDNVNRGFHGAPNLLGFTAAGLSYFDERVLRSVGLGFAGYSAKIWYGSYNLWIYSINKIFGRIGQTLRTLFMTMFKFDYSTKGDRRFQAINISNIDFDLYILLIVIGVLLVTSLLFIL